VTRQLLPADVPLWGSALRALPAGLVLLAIARTLPRGAWWWRSAVLGTMNVGAFFLLVYVAAQLLPSSVAASVMALAPLAMAGFGWLLVSERPTSLLLVGSVAGIAGVLLLVGGGSGTIDAVGVAAALTALVLSCCGAVLTKRWADDDTSLLAMTSWQLVAGGGVLTLAAALVEGAPPSLDSRNASGFVFTSLVATAIAYLCWFGGLARLRAATVGVIGLLNPVTGVLLGALVAHESFTLAQVLGLTLVLAGILTASQSGTKRIPVQPEPDLLPSPSQELPVLAGARA
jgi:probable blue pigment (indigoidine) exporter